MLFAHLKTPTLGPSPIAIAPGLTGASERVPALAATAAEPAQARSATWGHGLPANDAMSRLN